MELKSLLVAMLGIVLCSIVVESKKLSRAQRRAAVERNKWYRDVNVKVTVKEAAACLRSKERIFFKSADRKLRQAGIIRSVSYIDYTSDVMVIKAYLAGSRKCLVLPGNITEDFNTTVQDILTRDRVNETVDIGEFVMSSDAVMSQAERDNFTIDNSYLARVCRRNEMLNTTLPFTETTDVLDKYPVKLLTVGGTVTVYINAAIGLGPA